MFDSAVIDVAITLMFVYLLLALIVAGFNEFVFTFWHVKANKLKYAIENMFYDKEWKDISKQIFRSPFINSLKRKQNEFPSEIPPKIFILALLSSIGNCKTSIESIKELLSKTEKKGEFLKMLDVLVNQENYTLDKLTQELEILYSNVSLRASAWYKRKAKLWSFFVALTISLICNIDTVNITRKLWENKEITQNTSSFVTDLTKSISTKNSQIDIIKTNGDTISTTKISNQPDTSNINSIKAISPSNNAEIKNVVKNKSNKELKEESRDTIEERSQVAKSAENNMIQLTQYLNQLPIPMGWIKGNYPVSLSCFWEAVILWVLKLMGIMLTSFAVTLGAPFWFDLLQRVSPVKKNKNT